MRARGSRAPPPSAPLPLGPGPRAMRGARPPPAWADFPDDWTIHFWTDSPAVGPSCCPYSPKYVEGAFCELRLCRVLGSSVSIALIVWAAMWLGSEVGGAILHLATAVHIVELVGNVMVLAFTAKELISPENTADFSTTICGPVKIIVAIATVEHVIVLSAVQEVFARSAMEHVFAAFFIRSTPKSATHQRVVALPAVDDVAA